MLSCLVFVSLVMGKTFGTQPNMCGCDTNAYNNVKKGTQNSSGQFPKEFTAKYYLSYVSQIAAFSLGITYCRA